MIASTASPRISLPPLEAVKDREPWPEVAAAFFKVRGSGAEPFLQTSVKTAWDSEEWRILFDAEGSAPTERLGVSFDPVGDAASFFEIGVTPENRTSQAVYRTNRSGFKKNTAWECDGFQSVIKTTATGWSAEFSIPFSGLGPLRPPAPWKACFWREPGSVASGERTAWPPGSPLSIHRPQEFGMVIWVDARSKIPIARRATGESIPAMSNAQMQQILDDL